MVKRMILIVAVDDQWGIAKQGDLLARLPKDLEFFKEKTVNKAIVIGRKTLESFRNGQPLPKRLNVVLSRSADFDHPRILGIKSVEALEQWLTSQGEEDVFLAGGGEIYHLLAPLCNKAYVTRIEGDLEAEVHMPNLESLGFRCLLEEPVIEENGFRYRHTTWLNTHLLEGEAGKG